MNHQMHQNSNGRPRKRNIVVRFFSGIWRTIDLTRRLVLNVIFLLVVLVILLAMFDSGGPVSRPDTALVIEPQGFVVEQYTADATERAINELVGQATPETRLRDIVAAIKKAKDDPNITQLVLRPDQIWGVGLSKLQEVGEAIADFKTSGKPVISYSLYLGQSNFYLAALADEVWLHPEGIVMLEGFSAYRNYYKDAMDKYGITMHIFRAGEYKSYGEPYARSDMSPESKEANRFWLSGLWAEYLSDIAAMRGLDPGALDAFVNRQHEYIAAADGDIVMAALDFGLIDRIGSVDEFRQRVASRGAEDGNSFRQVGLNGYVELPTLSTPGQAEIAVVVAQGGISGGDQPPGTVGGESLSRMLREARNDDDIKAIVLRVDSPGGGVLPSERIRHQIELARTGGKPVIVSMSSVAASGGYWISINADQIFANPTTITGSIGVFAALPKAGTLMNNVGVNTDGVATTDIAGALNLGTELPEQVAAAFQSSVDETYQDFIGHIAEARNLDVAAVDEVGRGRVWSGAQALERGLVDQLGGLDDAIDAAAQLAGVSDYQVRYVEQQPTAFERFLLDLSASHPGVLSSLYPQSWITESLVDRQTRKDLQMLLAEPAGRLSVWSHCLCELP